jgi:Gram-negative bacterial TonB protein C-terminal
MTSPIFIIKARRSWVVCFFALILSIPIEAQRVAVLSPDDLEPSRSFAEILEAALAKRLVVIDDSISEAVFASIKPENPLNLTAENSKNIAAAIGCDFFILTRSATQRRSASGRPQYYESFAAVFAVSGRTGRLVVWSLPRFEAARSTDSQRMLNQFIGRLANEIGSKLKDVIKSELAEPPVSVMETPPDEGSPSAKNFKAPIPYKRIKPEYTADAFLYEIAATVDIAVDLDARGSILRTEIVRWAGYGLDESVENAVRAMNWRPAERNGKPLPMRFSLRYNFKKIEKE